MKRIALGLLLGTLSPPALSEPVASAPDGFQIALTRTSELSAPDLFLKIGDLPSWWSPDHTYSGHAENLSLSAMTAGGLWLETTDGISVEHGRVIARFDRENTQIIRFSAALGPLQEIGAKGVLTITVTPETDPETPALSNVAFSYYVTGADFQALDTWAPIVDGVLTEQIDRLVSD